MRFHPYKKNITKTTCTKKENIKSEKEKHKIRERIRIPRCWTGGKEKTPCFLFSRRPATSRTPVLLCATDRNERHDDQAAVEAETASDYDKRRRRKARRETDDCAKRGASFPHAKHSPSCVLTIPMTQCCRRARSNSMTLPLRNERRCTRSLEAVKTTWFRRAW